MEEGTKEVSGLYDSVHTCFYFWRSETRITTFCLMFSICFLFSSHKYGYITLQ
jgi:hypothetical protein